MGAINGAEAILEILQLHGTEFIFCSPIAVWAPLWEALAQRHEGGVDTPRYLNCRHELLAVGLASGYYKATGRPQVVLLATGLGVLNGSMGLQTAMKERTPLTVLAPDTHTYGDVPALDPGPEWPSLLVDLPGPVRHGEAVVKWAGAALRTHNLYGRPIEPTPDYAALVAAYNGYGERVGVEAEIGPAIERALRAVAGGQFALLDVLVEP